MMMFLEMVLERSVYFWTGVVFAEYWNMHLQHMQMHVEVDDFIFVFASAGFCNKLWRTMCIDILEYAKRAYLGPDVPPLPTPFRTYDEWTA